ncbi:Fe3+/spermidine/putrescine ABC transporter ATP-binding protein [Alphaproteobacteria bacterium 46_93_T64]|nr:Fe3+/spermidine/putrescine ABC transporter ATP-binding protein [Alphaproteobacteria bacterium 46_93_T64]
MSNNSSFISIQNVSKSFGSVAAVSDVSMEIGGGEFFSLLGPSGCGKTTLLRMLAGFETPTSGEIVIDGQSMSAVPPHQRPVNMVFQNYAIFPHLNIHDNIAYGMRKERLPQAELDKKVEEMLEMIKLPGYGKRRSHELSGGERQRVALARALIKRPKVLLLDEPLGALDKQLREQMQMELRALQRSVGITFVFVTHDQEEALTMSDRIAVMSKGRTLQIDSPTELYEKPITREVAAFIGTMNFFDGRVVSVDNDQIIVDAGALGIVKGIKDTTNFGVGEMAQIAVRPEKFSLSIGAPNGVGNFIEGNMISTAYLGERSYFHIAVNGIDQPIAVSAQNSASADINIRDHKGQVWLGWPDAAVVLLKQDASHSQAQ